MSNSDLKQKAQADIKGRAVVSLVPAIIVSAVYSLITFCINKFIPWDSDYLGMITTVLSLLFFPFTIGTYSIYVGYYNGHENMIKEDFFKPLKKYFKIIACDIVYSVIVSVGCILLIVPGIIWALRYGLVFYILADEENDNLTVKEIFAMSKQLTDGRKWKLFCLGFSFVGWYFLSVLTLGILLLYVIPYSEMSLVNFYMDCKPQKPEPVKETFYDDNPFITYK